MSDEFSLGEIRRSVSEIKEVIKVIPTHQAKIEAFEQRVEKLDTSITRLSMAILAFATTVGGGVVVAAVSILIPS